MKLSDMIFYRNPDNKEIFATMLEMAYGGNPDRERINNCISHILDITERMGFRGNCWNNYLTYNLVNDENAFSISCEKKGKREGSINKVVKSDIAGFRRLFDFDLRKYDEENNTCLSYLLDFENNNEEEKYFNKRIRNKIIELSEALCAAESDESFLDILCDFYKETGVGKIGLFKAFRVKDGQINPVLSTEHKFLKDIIGYDIQKKKVTDNTEAFLVGKKANNVLLYGDSGTGKSSCIKAILNEYYDRGLRMIEIYKHQFKDLSAVINQVKDRNYKFIIYMDDLSFEEFEIEYKFLKAVIEGGLEKRPDNVLIYATSNRRHLVREKFSDKEERDDDLHKRDTVEEKLSLSARFGVSVYFGSPDKKLFNQIVKALAERNSIDIDEDTLLAEANKWELSHGGFSGRTAEQFIGYLEGIYG